MNQPAAEQKSDCVVAGPVCAHVSLQLFTKGICVHRTLTEMDNVILKL